MGLPDAASRKIFTFFDYMTISTAHLKNKFGRERKHIIDFTFNCLLSGIS